MATATPHQARLVHYGPNEAMSRHAHERACITLLLDGAVEERVGNAAVTGLEHQLVIRPPDVEHAIRCGPRGMRTLQIYLSAQEERRWREESSVLDRWRWMRRDGAALAMLRVLASDRCRTEAWTRAEALTELAALLDPQTPRRERVPRWLEEARQRLAERDTCIHVLASEYGVHPITFTRRFRAAFQSTPVAFRRRMRVERAVRALLERGDSIANVAFDHGFADQAHFTRETGELAGWTPAALRDLVRTFAN